RAAAARGGSLVRLPLLEAPRRVAALRDHLLDERAALGIHLDELDPHPRRLARARVLVAIPHDPTDAVDQARIVLQTELELEQRPDGHRLRRFDEDSASADVEAVLLDELIERSALESNLDGDGSALVLARVGHSVASKDPGTPCPAQP